jgi:hypothetical protein
VAARFAAERVQEPAMIGLTVPVLGQTQDNLFDVILAVFSKPDTLAHPGDLVTHLQALSVVWAVIFLAAGLTCMLNGYKYYRVVTIVLALALGVFSGYYLGGHLLATHDHLGARYIVGGCLGALFAVGCFPLMKYAVAVFGGLAGAFLGANLWSAAAHLRYGQDQAAALAAENYWIGALIGLLVCGMLAFILFKFAVIVFTSVSGSTVAVIGAVALLLQVPGWQQTVSQSITAHAIVIPLLVLVPAVIGLILQETHGQAGDAKKPAAT